MQGVMGQRLFQGFIIFRVPGSFDPHISTVLMPAFSQAEAIGKVVAVVQADSPGAIVQSHCIEQIDDPVILDAYEHLAYTPDGKRQVRFGLGGK